MYHSKFIFVFIQIRSSDDCQSFQVNIFALLSVKGFMGKALRVQQRLLQRFPDDLQLRNKMGVTFLLMNQGPSAREVFESVLHQWPDDGFAQVRGILCLRTDIKKVSTGTGLYGITSWLLLYHRLLALSSSLSLFHPFFCTYCFYLSLIWEALLQLGRIIFFLCYQFSSYCWTLKSQLMMAFSL